MPGPSPTRAEIWRKICERIPSEERLSVWRATNAIAPVPDDEWAAAHAGVCEYCKAETARLYPCGWRCDDCKP